MKKLWCIIITLIMSAIAMPIAAYQNSRIGEYAMVRFVRRKGSTTKWKKGVSVKVIAEHPGMVMTDGTVTDYTVIMDNEDVAFPTEEQLEFDDRGEK